MLCKNDSSCSCCMFRHFYSHRIMTSSSTAWFFPILLYYTMSTWDQTVHYEPVLGIGRMCNSTVDSNRFALRCDAESIPNGSPKLLIQWKFKTSEIHKRTMKYYLYGVSVMVAVEVDGNLVQLIFRLEIRFQLHAVNRNELLTTVRCHSRMAHDIIILSRFVRNRLWTKWAMRINITMYNLHSMFSTLQLYYSIQMIAVRSTTYRPNNSVRLITSSDAQPK